MGSYRNIMPGFSPRPTTRPPARLGQCCSAARAIAAYNPNRGIYHFRWFWDTSGGQMTNLAQHSLDVVHWCLGVRAPAKSVYKRRRPFLPD